MSDVMSLEMEVNKLEENRVGIQLGKVWGSQPSAPALLDAKTLIRAQRHPRFSPQSAEN